MKETLVMNKNKPVSKVIKAKMHPRITPTTPKKQISPKTFKYSRSMYMTVADIANYWGVLPNTIYNYRVANTIPEPTSTCRLGKAGAAAILWRTHAVVSHRQAAKVRVRAFRNQDFCAVEITKLMPLTIHQVQELITEDIISGIDNNWKQFLLISSKLTKSKN